MSTRLIVQVQENPYPLSYLTTIWPGKSVLAKKLKSRQPLKATGFYVRYLSTRPYILNPTVSITFPPVSFSEANVFALGAASL